MDIEAVSRTIAQQHVYVFDEARQTYGQDMAIVGTIVFVAALIAEMKPLGQARFFADLYTLLGLPPGQKRECV